MLKKIGQSFLYFTYLVGSVLILVEGASQVYVRAIRPDLVNQEIEDNQNFKVVTEWQDEIKASPYFGYVKKNGNNYGFDSKESFPIKRNNNTYVIAIAGGSVAKHLANQISADKKYIDKLKTMIPSLKGKDIRIMNLSLNGYSQPQQFFAVSYFIDDIDLLIQLDGWNEAWVRTVNKYPADYPVYNEILYDENLAANLSVLKTNKKIITTIEQSKILNKSYSLLILTNILQKDINKKSSNLIDQSDAAFNESNNIGRHVKTLSVRSWVKYLKMEQTLLNAYNKKSFFFIQPSQYNAESKPFSKKEKEIAFHQNPNTIESTNAFQHLRKEGKKLKVWDLVDVFKNVQGDIYTDNCCHINKQGNQIMTEAIFGIISANF